MFHLISILLRLVVQFSYFDIVVNAVHLAGMYMLHTRTVCYLPSQQHCGASSSVFDGSPGESSSLYVLYWIVHLPTYKTEKYDLFVMYQLSSYK